MTHINTQHRRGPGRSTPSEPRPTDTHPASGGPGDAGDAPPDDQARHLRFILEAIEKTATIRLVFNGHERIIAPHRVWRQPDGTVLIESFQIAGGSAWGGMAGSGLTRSPISGWQGWINIPLEKIEQIIGGGDPFSPHHDFNPNPERRLGIIEAQVRKQVRTQVRTRGARP